MPTITQLKSQLNELNARKLQLSDRNYYSEQEEEYRLPPLQEKIDMLEAQLADMRHSINAIKVKDPEILNDSHIQPSTL